VVLRLRSGGGITAHESARRVYECFSAAVIRENYPFSIAVLEAPVEKERGCDQRRYVVARPSSQNHLYTLSRNGVLVAYNPIDVCRIAVQLADLFAFEAELVAVSSLTMDTAARQWISVVGGHGYQLYPEWVLSNSNAPNTVRERSTHGYISGYWAERKRTYNCSLQNTCDCDACSLDDHSYCRSTGVSACIFFFDCDCGCPVCLDDAGHSRPTTVTVQTSPATIVLARDHTLVQYFS